MQSASQEVHEAPGSKDTVAMYFVAAAVRKLSPASRHRVLASAGIPEALLSLAAARVPAHAFSTLWLTVARELDDEFFGLDRRSMKVGSFALLARSALGCRDLGDALKCILRGMGLFLDGIGGRLLVGRAEAAVQVGNRIVPADDRRFADETFLVLVHGLMCWLVGHRIEVDRIEFAHPRPAHAAEYTAMFSPQVAFDAEATRLCFGVEALAAPVVQTPDTLHTFLRAAPQSVFLKYRNEQSWTARLRRRLRGCVDSGAWPVFEDVALHCGVTPTTLRRRLEAEGTSFQAIKDRLRSDVAVERLCRGTSSIDEVAAGLGFHDASSFHRAFRRWTGLQPGEYRRRRLHGKGVGA